MNDSTGRTKLFSRAGPESTDLIDLVYLTKSFIAMSGGHCAHCVWGALRLFCQSVAGFDIEWRTTSSWRNWSGTKVVRIGLDGEHSTINISNVRSVQGGLTGYFTGTASAVLHILKIFLSPERNPV